MIAESRSTDPKIHQTAVAIAQGCLWIIRCCLREEEWQDAFVEFYGIAREKLEEYRDGEAGGGKA